MASHLCCGRTSRSHCRTSGNALASRSTAEALQRWPGKPHAVLAGFAAVVLEACSDSGSLTYLAVAEEAEAERKLAK
ncbi:Hypothetical predicted protein, partial [Podarcis lilfordi]